MHKALLLAGLLVSAVSPGLAEGWLPPDEVVRRYSRTVACQIPESSADLRQYVSVRLEPGRPDGDVGALWLVGWSGDLGCMGGNGTQGAHLALVMQNGFSRGTVSPVVIDAKPIPGLLLWSISHLTEANGVITIRGQRSNPAVVGDAAVEERYRWCGWSGSRQEPRFESVSSSGPGEVQCPP